MISNIQTGLQAPATTIPPLSDADIRGTANMIITRHGNDALRFAAQQMEHCHRRGDQREHTIWARIGMEIDAQETAPAHAVAA